LKPERGEKSGTRWLTLEDGYEPYLKQHGKRKPGGAAFRAITPELAGNQTRMKRYSSPAAGCYEEGLDFFFDSYITSCSLRALRERDQSKPFLLNAMYVAPHPPLEIPEPWYSKLHEEEVVLPDNVGRWWPDQSPLQLYNLPGAIGSRYEREDWREPWRVYLGLVSLLDDAVGKLIAELKEQGMYDDTLLVFTSDHGEMLGSHCLWQKMCMYEEAVRTP
jgi:arylsulfatase A-like enzyme